jgi:tRNA splicing ligase
MNQINTILLQRSINHLCLPRKLLKPDLSDRISHHLIQIRVILVDILNELIICLQNSLQLIQQPWSHILEIRDFSHWKIKLKTSLHQSIIIFDVILKAG